jgi:beta-phosphoglucomutase family hydrolase
VGRSDLDRFDAMLFDLDGVITRTASVHAAAWQQLFDEFLTEWSAHQDQPFRPFDVDVDYRRYVDGRRRPDGIAAFLASRGIELPAGGPDDPEGAPTVAGLGRRKDRWFNEALEQQGVEAFGDGVRLVERLHELGKQIAVVSASENCIPVLRRAGLLHLFPVQVTGVDARELGLAGKPAPDTFLEGARRLGVEPSHAVVFEDAIAGVGAARAGGFGLVVGVDRTGAAAELEAGGADVVVSDLTELLP